MGTKKKGNPKDLKPPAKGGSLTLEDIMKELHLQKSEFNNQIN